MKTSRIFFNTLAIASLTLSGIACADEITKEGYLTDNSGNVVKSGNGQCWHTGFWSPAMAIEECDPDQARKNKPKIAEARMRAAAPAPAKSDATVAAQEKAVYVPIVLEADTLFDFDKSDIHASGKKKLDDEIIGKIKKYQQDGVILVTGYTDRIGTEAYNMKLSQRRADTVKSYLVSQGIASNRVETAVKGESDPLISCDNVKGKANNSNKKLVECLKPNRRVIVEVKVQKPVQN